MPGRAVVLAMLGDGRPARSRAWRKVGAAVVIVVLAAFPCEIASPTAPARAGSVTDGAPTRYLDPVFADATVTRDQVYGQVPAGSGGPADLLADLYEPSGDVEALRPAVVWMHGSGAASNDKAHPVDAYIATSFARHGTVVMSINYRYILPGQNLPVDDAHAALAWLHAHAGAYRIDTSRIAIGGVSSGAIAALDTAYLPDHSMGEPAEEHRVRAALSISGTGTMDVTEAGEPPAMMVHGENDTVVPLVKAKAFCDQARANGVSCTLATYPAGHADIVAFAADIEPMLARWFYDVLDLASLDATPPSTTTTSTTSTPGTPSNEVPRLGPVPPVATDPRFVG